MVKIAVILLAGLLACRVSGNLSESDASPSAHRKNNLTMEQKVMLRRAARGKLIQSYMNESVNPCDDFYEYACGNWKFANRPPSVFDENDVFQLIVRRMESQIGALLREINGESQNLTSEALMKVKLYYDSCMDYDFTTRLRSQAKSEILDSIFGPYVLSAEWSSDRFDWLSTVARMQSYGSNAFIYQSVSKYNKTPAIHLKKADVKLPGLDIPDFLLPDPGLSRKLQSTILAERYGLSDKESIENVIDFGIQLNNLVMSNDRGSPLKTEPVNLTKLKDMTPTIDWSRYFTVLLGSQMNFSMQIIIEDVNYFRQLEILLRRTPADTLANYLALHFLEHLQENVQISKFSQHRYCSARVLEDMPLATYVLHLHKFNLTGVKPEILQIAKALQYQFQQAIDHSDWLEDHLKSQIINKLNHTQLEIGYPDYLSSNNQLDKIYSDLIVNSSHFDRNFLHCLEFKTRSMHNKLSPLMAADIDLNLSLMDIKPRYDPITDRITIPAGILVPPIYHQHLPMAFKFGSLGPMVAHTYTNVLSGLHRPDAGSRKYVKKMEEFDRCYNFQTTNLDLDLDADKKWPFADEANSREDGGGVGVDLKEIRSDFGELDEAYYEDIRNRFYEVVSTQIAYSAYNSFITADKIDDERMPGLNLTNHQLFFVSFTQAQCSDYSIDPFLVDIGLDNNFSRRSRVLSSVSSNLNFWNSFNCSRESATFLQKNCTLLI